MLLDMAVKQSWSRLVGSKVHAGAPIGGHHDRVLDYSRGGFAINLGDLELVTMHVQRMRIVSAVMKRQPVARTLFEQKLLVVGIGFAVYVEAVEFAGAARHLFKHHVQSLGGRRLRR